MSSNRYGKYGYDHRREQLARIEKREEAMSDEVKALTAEEIQHERVIVEPGWGAPLQTERRRWLATIDALTAERDALKRQMAHTRDAEIGRVRTEARFALEDALNQRTRECAKEACWWCKIDKPRISGEFHYGSLECRASNLRRRYPDAFAEEVKP